MRRKYRLTKKDGMWRVYAPHAILPIIAAKTPARAMDKLRDQLRLAKIRSAH